MISTSSEYYDDEKSHGEYQYILLSDIVNDYMFSRSSDDYTSTEERFKIIYQARRAFKELFYDSLREIRAIEIELNPKLNLIVPPDFVNLVRVSWVDSDNQLHPIVYNDKFSMAQVYLQDHDYNLLFDDSGCVLKDDSSYNYTANKNYKTFSICNSFEPNKNNANVYNNGYYNFDKSSGVIQFNSEVGGKNIVLEYLSDGLFTGCEGKDESLLRIHKFAETAVRDYIYYELIKNRRNVPFNEKMRARKEWFNSKRIVERRINTLRKEDLLQSFKGANKWIK